MSKEMPIAHGLLLRGAETYLSCTGNIAHITGNIRQNPEGFKVRVNQFTKVCNALSEYVSCSSALNHQDYFNVFRLKAILNGRPLPTIKDIIKDRAAFYEAQEAYKGIDRKIQCGEWEFPTKIKDEGVLVSGLLIEGYGLFLERIYGSSELSRNFVLAFEEVLWHRCQGSPMLKDVLPWMVEERRSFSYNMEGKLSAASLQ